MNELSGSIAVGPSDFTQILLLNGCSIALETRSRTRMTRVFRPIIHMRFSIHLVFMERRCPKDAAVHLDVINEIYKRYSSSTRKKATLQETAVR
jgi:hypothetical protein